MRCSKAVHQIQLYIDHQLTLRQTRVLEAHVAACSSCREELVLLEAVSCGLATLISLLQLPFMQHLPSAHGHDLFSLFYTQVTHMLTTIDTNTLSLALWI